MSAMSLLKLVHDPEMNAWARQKAVDVLNAIPSQDLILEAYLFGSAANGNFTVNSDLDFLVVTKDFAAVRQLRKEVYAPRFSDVAIDWIFKTKESFDERKQIGGVCFIAFREGIRLR
jgi:predicted nucleotidyltransferase